MKRTIFIILLFLLFGAILNIAAFWVPVTGKSVGSG